MISDKQVPCSDCGKPIIYYDDKVTLCVRCTLRKFETNEDSRPINNYQNTKRKLLKTMLEEVGKQNRELINENEFLRKIKNHYREENEMLKSKIEDLMAMFAVDGRESELEEVL